ncbi:MAG: alpha/beta hydrolase [Actinomycetota bacterium]
MPRTFLIASIVGFAFALNARRSLRWQITLVPAFFASWLTIELAPQLLVLHLAGVGVFIALDGLAEWPGWVALGISAVAAGLLWGLVRESFRSEATFEASLGEIIGPAEDRSLVRWRDFAFPFKLWDRRVHRVRDLPYAAPGGRRLRLDVWRQKERTTGRPCLLYVPGGGWSALVTNKNQQGKPLLIEMVARDWVCFVVNYPVSPRAAFPEHIVAVKRAIAWIREHAHEYGGDPRFLMVTGNSAGGHLAALAALTPNDPDYQPGFEDADTSIQAAAPLYGVYDFTGAMLDELPRPTRRHKKGMLRFLERAIVKRRLVTERDVFERGSPWHRVGSHAPPFFVIHGAMDSLALVEEARAFATRLREASREPVVYAELPGTQHAFDTFLSIRSLYAVRAIARFADWAYERWKVSDARRELPSDRAAPSPKSLP